MALADAWKTAVASIFLFALFYFVYPPAATVNTGNNANFTAIDAIIFGSTTIGGFIVLLLDKFMLSFKSIRICYTSLAVSLLIYRTVLYWLHGWILFMLDLCPVCQYLLLWTLWNPQYLKDKNWRNAVLTNLNGPIAGSTFLLSIKVSVDNAEVFMGFFLHVAPMWLSFPLYWRLFQDTESTETVCSLFKNGMMKLYLKWYVFMGIFLTLQPFVPGICNLMTLYDWMGGSIMGYKLIPRTWPFWKWTMAAWIYVSVHAIMASYGMLMAAMSYHYRSVHRTFAGCVLLGIVTRSIAHYAFTGKHTLMIGLVEAAVAGVVVSGVYWYEQKSAKAREAREAATEPLL